MYITMKRILQPTWIQCIHRPSTILPPFQWIHHNDMWTPCYAHSSMTHLHLCLHQYVNIASSCELALAPALELPVLASTVLELDETDYEPINHELVVSGLDDDTWEWVPSNGNTSGASVP